MFLVLIAVCMCVLPRMSLPRRLNLLRARSSSLLVYISRDEPVSNSPLSQNLGKVAFSLLLFIFFILILS